MNFSELEVGYHVTEPEHKYAVSVVNRVARAGHSAEKILVVGSRKNAHRVSFKSMAVYCGHALNSEDLKSWFDITDDIARTFRISAGQIRDVGRYLDHECPDVVRDFFRSRQTRQDSDLDLLLAERPNGINLVYSDRSSFWGSGLRVDLWSPEGMWVTA